MWENRVLVVEEADVISRYNRTKTTFPRISRIRIIYSFDPNLGEVLCIFTSFHFSDSGLYLSNGFDFYFDLF